MLRSTTHPYYPPLPQKKAETETEAQPVAGETPEHCYYIWRYAPLTARTVAAAPTPPDSLTGTGDPYTVQIDKMPTKCPDGSLYGFIFNETKYFYLSDCHTKYGYLSDYDPEDTERTEATVADTGTDTQLTKTTGKILPAKENILCQIKFRSHSNNEGQDKSAVDAPFKKEQEQYLSNLFTLGFDRLFRTTEASNSQYLGSFCHNLANYLAFGLTYQPIRYFPQEKWFENCPFAEIIPYNPGALRWGDIVQFSTAADGILRHSAFYIGNNICINKHGFLPICFQDLGALATEDRTVRIVRRKVWTQAPTCLYNDELRKKFTPPA